MYNFFIVPRSVTLKSLTTYTTFAKNYAYLIVCVARQTNHEQVGRTLHHRDRYALGNHSVTEAF